MSGPRYARRRRLATGLPKPGISGPIVLEGFQPDIDHVIVTGADHNGRLIRETVDTRPGGSKATAAAFARVFSVARGASPEAAK